jgi:2-oxo-4-hydroxy-4-carboxy-5-ureidoimidazoline decarboxylase
MDMRPHTLDALNALDRDAFVALLGNVYEHRTNAAEAAFAARPFATLGAVFAAFRQSAREGSEAERMALVRSHPDLAERAARAGTLTPDSAGEQRAAGLDRMGKADYATFHRLNDAYRGKFGFPFIICVRRHTKDSILANFERRLAHAPDEELGAALDEIDRIAALRLSALVTGDGTLNVNGRLTTHVLDAQSGRPAAGVAVTLRELSQSGDARTVAEAVTNDDGRTSAPLIADRPLPIGRYELSFMAGDYFVRQQATLSDPPFLDVVPVRFAIAEAEGNYHVPLLLTPWSYSTYRGS